MPVSCIMSQDYFVGLYNYICGTQRRMNPFNVARIACKTKLIYVFLASLLY